MKKAIVIVCKKINSLTLAYYVNEFKETDIIIVSPESISHKFLQGNVISKTDDFFLKRSDYKCIEDTPRPNWYYQQFLKYKIVLFLDYDIVHIVDGDSFVRKDLIFSNLIFYSKKNIEKEYSSFIKIFSKDSVYSCRNYITNQMCFNKTYLQDLIDAFTENNNDWILKICQILKENDNVWLSEYQLYANEVLKKGIAKEKEIKVFRRYDIINKSYIEGFKNYSVLAIENQHKTGFLRIIWARVFYFFKLNLG